MAVHGGRYGAQRSRRRRWRAGIAAAGMLALGAGARGQMVTGRDMTDFETVFGVKKHVQNAPYTAVLAQSSVAGNLLFPGEQPTFTVQIVNNGDQPMQAKGKFEVIAYGTKGKPGDVWVPTVFKIGETMTLPVSVNVAAKGFQDVTVAPKIPARFGAYALVLDMGPGGRQFITTFVRTFAASTERIQYPHFCLDELPFDVMKRLGVQAIRLGIGYKPTTDGDFERWYGEQAARIKRLYDNNITVLFMIGGGEFFNDTQPLARPRPWLDDSNTMKDTKFDLAWLPKYDPDFTKFCARFAGDLGWPKGPLTAFSLWNEPWEGISISGWGADMMRYREIFTAMAHGVEQARAQQNVQVLLGGGDSTSNAMDKFFGDGSDDFMKWFDFVSIHYQGLDPNSTVKKWINRESPNGRVKIWDTESWVANVDDRVAAVVAGDRAAGYDRAMGVFGGNISDEDSYEIRTAAGKPKRVTRVNTWSVAASIGATQHFLGERDFREILFKNGLPWVFVFDGLKGANGTINAEEGTLVVVGDIGEEFGHDGLPFRTARGFKEREHKAAMRAKLAALPASTPAKERAELEAAIASAETLSGGSLTLNAGGGQFSLYDFYGNPLPAKGGKITVPLDGRGFFLRGNGKPGSFAKLIAAVRAARVEGIEPLATQAHDMTASIAARPTLRLSLTNVLNRPIKGTFALRMGKLKTDAPASLQFAPNETKQVAVKITGGDANTTNTYPLAYTFDAGADGKVVYAEEMHVNTIPHRNITVDGNLDDWKDVAPQTIVSSGPSAPSLTEAAWFPFKNFDASVKKGFATGYLAYDDASFYFAAKIADDTPDEGMLRFETRNDDEFFYPEKTYVKRISHSGTAPFEDKDNDTPRELTWPEGVRRYSYRKDPELPSGNFPDHDNVQIAFNVLPADQKPNLPYPPGTLPGYTNYADTDYEYALNPVATKYGGGTEIWRLNVPGMPHKHFYPRQGKSPFDGPVKDGKLVVKRDGNTRLVECSIPWSELPDVKKKLDAGETVKFSFRVNDNAGVGCMELSRYRSVAKRNGSFHVDWAEHWANELEFGFEK